MYLEKNEPQQLVSNKSEGEFSVVRNKALRIREIWQDVYQQSQQLDTSYTTEFKAHNAKIEEALDKLLADLDAPTLTLATTGTTSSGKSTLVNLLCGADIMPRMAGEMSAGIVTIKHSRDGKRHLKIQPTENADWDYGEWQDLNDNEIREKLTSTMDAFNRAKQQRELSSPIIELTYPIACFFPQAGLLNLSDLPVNTQFQIMDLPGKRNQDDQINSVVIQNCRQALSIVTYDMAQTDEKLRQSLMEEVLEQVKLMGGSPARMLFALNRIDVFRRDRDWERREQDAVNQTVNEIKQIIHERLPEHRHSLEQLSCSKLSGLPALLAWLIKTTESDSKIEAAEQINDHFAFMMPDVKDDLSRSVKKWSDYDCEKVHEAIMENSYVKGFLTILEEHIHKNFFEIIITPALLEFKDKTLGILGGIINNCNANIEVSTKNYQVAKQNLDESYQKVNAILDQTYREVMQLPQLFLNKNDIDSKSFHSVNSKNELSGNKFYDLLGDDILASLCSAPEEITRRLSGTVEGAIQSLNQGKINFSDTQADYLSSKHQDRLKVICNNLMGKGYTKEVARRGVDISSVGDEKEEVKRFKKILNDFSENLSKLLNDVYKEKSSRENLRIKELLERYMFNCIVYINGETKNAKLNLNVNIPSSILHEVSLDFSRIFNLKSNTSESTLIEGIPWFLWLIKQSVTYTHIPSTVELHEDYIENIKKVENSVFTSLAEIMEKYFQAVEVKIHDHLDRIINDANKKYDESFSRVDEDYKIDVNRFIKIKAQSCEISGIIENEFLDFQQEVEAI